MASSCGPEGLSSQPWTTPRRDSRPPRRTILDWDNDSTPGKLPGSNMDTQGSHISYLFMWSHQILHSLRSNGNRENTAGGHYHATRPSSASSVPSLRDHNACASVCGDNVKVTATPGALHYFELWQSSTRAFSLQQRGISQMSDRILSDISGAGSRCQCN